MATILDPSTVLATSPPLVRSISDLRGHIKSWRVAGQSIALVPTMGCLHQGHLALVDRAAELADQVVVSIFVNPLQFAAGEDLEHYPRTLEADLEALANRDCALVFAPAEEELYPHGREGLTEVRVPGLSARYCGEHRPGHFEGVTTVVNLLLNIAQPDVAVFGEKDRQQLFLIERMTSDLHLPVRIVGVPTMREPDQLAMSSRNRYLSPQEREQAAHFPRVLQEVVHQLRSADVNIETVMEQAREQLLSAGLHPQYLELVSAEFQPVRDLEAGDYFVLAAVTVGQARLIDNFAFSVDSAC